MRQALPVTVHPYRCIADGFDDAQLTNRDHHKVEGSVQASRKIVCSKNVSMGRNEYIPSRRSLWLTAGRLVDQRIAGFPVE